MTDTLGPYELRGELGRGAMAIVWRAFDTRLEREVALKEPMLPAGIDEATASEMGARFVREGKAAAGLNHPGIVTIYAADVYEGRPAIVMELIEGETLSDVLSRGALPPGAALAITDQLLDAAGYAHARGVVHRDIKPDNVFVTHDGRVKLADFGIAHMGTTAALTQAGTVMGTPGYMAPEQVTGQSVDARADLFAIGVLAHEMLSGSNPFGATDGVAPTTVMYRIVHEQMPQLPPVVLSGLPPHLTAVLSVATAKDPGDRFGDAQAFRAALAGGAIVTGGAAAAGAGAAQTAGVWSPGGIATVVGQQSSKNNWTPYIAVGGVMVAVVGLLVVFSGGGSSRGGAIAPVPSNAAPQPAPELVPDASASRSLLAGTYAEIGAYGNPASGRIKALADRFNKDPLTRGGASDATLQAAEGLLTEIGATKSSLASQDVAPELEGVKSTQLQLLEYCTTRVQVIVDGCYASQSGGDYAAAVAPGKAAKNAFVSLYPQGDPGQ